MRAENSTVGRGSINAARQTATETVIHDQQATETVFDCRSASEDDAWFADLAQPLLAGADGGYALHLLTGFLTNTCARYVARTPRNRRQPPGYFIRSLLRSEQGGVWLAAFMDGSAAQWWREHQCAAADQQKFRHIRTLVGER